LSIGAGLASAAGGGITPPDPPELADVTCVATCAGVHKATAGSKVDATGRHLAHVTHVLFDAEAGGQIPVDPISVGSRSVKAKVPDGATTGRPKVVDSYANSDSSPTELQIVSPDQIQASGDFKLQAASAAPGRAYFFGTRKPSVSYTFGNTEPTDVRIDVVRRSDGTVVDSWIEPAEEPYTPHTAKWDGTRDGSKRPAPNGGYRFRIGPESGSMDSSSDAKFQYHRFKFPVRGPHTYGDGVGAPRVGHTHQGQDILAACGTRLQAARGGHVQWKAYQAGGAGYYVVIDGKKTGHDYVYMHLKEASPLHDGDRVKTGQKIGRVGATGDASGCHLHFEEWSAPGWYEGGDFLASVTRHLKAWDSWS
jgi:murein DD-endopeptidase MepM/ murein hydrolase activator NlpD